MISVSPIFVFSSLNVNRAGLTKAVMRRANTLTHYFKDVQILTLQFQRNFKEIISRVRKSGQLNNKVIVKNLFIGLDPFKNNKQQKNSNIDVIEEKEFDVIKDEEEKNPAYFYYQNGVYVKYKQYDSKGRLVYIDYFNESRHRTRREEYDEQGYLVRIQNMDLITNKSRLHQYFSKNGTCFLSIWVDPETEQLGRCQLFYPDPMEFKDVIDLYSYWVAQEVDKVDLPVLMSDSRLLPTDEVLLSIPQEKAGKIAISHGNHFKKPYRNGAGYQRPWETLLNNLNRFDRVVLLTEEQKEDIIADFGDPNNLQVIPHEAKKVPHRRLKEKYNPYLAVALVRYEPQKRVDESIRAFAHVVQQLPDARFEIYGSGSLKQELQQLIEELGMENHIKLMGFTNDPMTCYKKAACTVLSSDFEGSPLVFNESLAVGTPVVTYDFKYGARDVIRHGTDGFVVPRGDQKALADRIISIMENPKLRDDMSKHALEITDRFSYEKYQTNWVQLIREVGKAPSRKKNFLSKLFKLA